MKHRIIMKSCWWSSIFDGDSLKYLYYDSITQHFEVGARTTARKHKWEFTDKEVDIVSNSYDMTGFFVEDVREKGDHI